MNIFTIVKQVLDELYEKIAPITTRDKQIESAMNYFSEEYPKLIEGVNIDYHAPAARFAYVYGYVTAHTSFIRKTIKACMPVYSKFGNTGTERLKITCLGGGPGTDLLGVIKFMKTEGFLNPITFYLVDREASWSDSWSDISDKTDLDGFSMNINFLELDVEKTEDWIKTEKYLSADIFISCYFFSELHRIREKADDYFRLIISKMPSGSHFIFIDNNNKAFTEPFLKIAGENGLTEIPVNVRAQTDTDEEKAVLGKYLEKFKDADGRARMPRLNGNYTVIKVFEKD